MSLRPLPIGKDEFARMFRKCMPPVGWANNIGVANSGGPDSTCLLFLLHRYLSDASYTTSSAPPRTIYSLTVDHDLQPSSSTMAEHCSKFAQSLGLQHITSKIPWSQPPYPLRPTDGRPFEHVARRARFLSLFESMTQTDVRIIALGHHADDQVETSLMRLSMGSTAAGAGAMRPFRRWGMGDYAVYGYEGMNRWIVRPMLEVAKDRILATCEEHNLEFVTDATNFQPSITLRNAIRHELRPDKVGETAEVEHVPEVVDRLNYLKQAVTSMKDVSFSLSSSPEALRNAVSDLSSKSQDINDQVDSVLKQCSLPTISGTFLISQRALDQISDVDVRRALVLRILRYTSFYPWGSVVADAGRRKRNLDHVIRELWGPLHKDTILRSFGAGGGVLWTPVILRQNFIKTPQTFIFGALQDGENLAWLASRLPPMHRDKLIDRGIPNTLEIDITKTIVEGWERWKSGGPSVVPILYDCRYLLRFDLERMPAAIATRLLEHSSEKTLRVYSRSRWLWPSVVLEANNSREVIHDKITEETTNIFLDVDVRAGTRYYLRAPPLSIDSGWITAEWVRPLTAM